MSRPLPRYTDTRLEDERKLARILLESGGSVPSPAARRGGDLAVEAQRLRGIPCIARGVGGTQPGSDPFRSMMDWPTRAA